MPLGKPLFSTIGWQRENELHAITNNIRMNYPQYDECGFPIVVGAFTDYRWR